MSYPQTEHDNHIDCPLCGRSHEYKGGEMICPVCIRNQILEECKRQGDFDD